MHRFPKLTTADLEGTSLSLPGDFGADQVLLLIAYVREDQRAVDTWFPLGQRLEAERDDFRFFELPVVGDMGFLRRRMLDQIIRRGIRDPRQRRRTLTLYVPRAPFQEALGLTEPSRIAAVLLDRSGAVRWTHYGPHTEAAEADLRRVLATTPC